MVSNASMEGQAVMRRSKMGAVKQVIPNGSVSVGRGPEERDGGAFDLILACQLV
jgi:hypothetical protein